MWAAAAVGAARDILPGGPHSRPQRPAWGHHRRLLAAYCDLGVREVREYALRGRPAEDVLRAEGRRLLAAWPRRRTVVALEVAGVPCDSPGLAGRLAGWLEGGGAAFVVGGSLGLAPEVLGRADERLSLSPLTLPHQLARVVLAEQLFRAFKILRREPYHR